MFRQCQDVSINDFCRDDTLSRFTASSRSEIGPFRL